ncbi:MAG TPA: DUF3105 domain-containing protein [Nocardioides sp.]|uniref:DUF3105 domain-containing protein n=1 Tax=Nocardioides sp. TaxID=35761 RepID=UPI002F3EE07A
MAKSSKSSASSRTTRTERQKVVEQMRARQKAAERRRGGIIVAVCVLVAVGIIVAAAWGPVVDHFRTSKYSGKPLARIGAPAGACQKTTTKPANGNQQHIPDGSPVSYPDSPPAFGEHYIDPDPMARKFYTSQDRPALGTLVHNEEHGYTILWYDDSVAGDDNQMSQIRAIADKFSGTTDLRHKFKAVPWTKDDGKPFPDGQHIAFTHWSVGGTANAAAGQAKQVGVWQYCSSVSGAALQTFMSDYPYTDSPEPNGM